MHLRYRICPTSQKERVTFEDLHAARSRFSANRLKDLGDEYAENFPRIQLVFSKFYGLGQEFTISGIEAFIKKLLVDAEVTHNCQRWIFRYTQTDLFIHLLYNLGFVGIKKGGIVQFRSAGTENAPAPSVDQHSIVVIHPSYSDALGLQNVVVGSLDPNISLRTSGLIIDLPGAIDLTGYMSELSTVQSELAKLPTGDAKASDYERIIGTVIKLCFFKSLTNVQPRQRDYSGRVIRDWIASNTATGGFWEMVRQRYGSTQVIWECKNYSNLGADDFHQAAYYMTKEIGRFVVICFRGDGDEKKSYYEHIKRISSEKDGGLVLLLADRDINVFIRQAINMKSREEHIREIFDRTVRAIS